ncbi:MAG: type 4a pilus biogenesis protein PilO [Candidatus Omnitrophica bacterium]|nr:type 4a pilus biogenesis protein PilO [Candidatus Omnitrophota bacterium]
MDNIQIVNKIKANQVTLVFIIIGLFFAYNVVKLQQRNLQNLKIEIEMEQQRNTILNEIAEREKRLSALRKALKERKTDINLGETLRNLAKANSIRIVELGQEEAPVVVASGIIVSIPYQLVVSCKSYHDLGEFISAIERNKDILFIKDISVRREDNKEEWLKAYIKLVHLLPKE